MAVYSKSAKARTLAEFLKEYWYIVIGCIVALPWAIKYIRSMSWDLAKQTEEHEKDVHFRESKDPEKLNARLNAIFNPIGVQLNSDYAQRIIGYARDLAEQSGVIYSDTDAWWSMLDPRGWGENDSAMYGTLLNIANNDTDNGDFLITLQVYYEITRQRNLWTDVLKYLDPAQLASLREYEYYSFL